MVDDVYHIQRGTDLIGDPNRLMLAIAYCGEHERFPYYKRVNIVREEHHEKHGWGTCAECIRLWKHAKGR